MLRVLGSLSLVVTPFRLAPPLAPARSRSWSRYLSRSHTVRMDTDSDIDRALTQIFNSYDADGSGSLTREEKRGADFSITQFLEQGKTFALRTGKFSAMDVDASGDVDLIEFVKGWKKQYSVYSPEMQLKMLTKVTDLIEAKKAEEARMQKENDEIVSEEARAASTQGEEKQRVEPPRFCLNVKLCIKPERREEFLTCIRSNQAGTLATEPLALEYVWGEDADVSNTFHFNEKYRGRAGFEAHQKTAHFAAWEEFASSEPFTEPPVVQLYEEM